MKNKFGLIIAAWVAFAGLQSCKQKDTKATAEDTVNSGTVKFAADESFQPIVDEEAYVFKQLNTKANPQILYRSENSVLRMLLNDSVRFAVLSRLLKPDEVKILKDRTLPPVINRFAVDAVTFIVNQSSADTLMTVNEIKKMLNGQTKTGTDIVFDNPNSSLVRYLKEFSGNKDFKLKNIFAVKTNKEVIRYISQHPQAIGITGFNWLNDPDDDYADAVKKVKIVAVKDESSKDAPNQYFKPSQTTLALKQYPFARNLYLVNCSGKLGLASGFAYFMLGERGQRVILRSGILPDSIPQREINIKHNY
ncbi:PstS family phosphate ABC transporter substrate-binding protein [Mucilaginibacter sp. UR6-11]|uniref:PstS family phosphate ABC transporter substrate-binding protein n=1 Tax=Mucilaginibacter sp. UR6-11 TaxID=1435644 RepID=UPI001E3AF121|nr:substrate-binding domain-containing protein [Mucilaginibacter sp. UR6-11]MCC8425305.1 substrate-binding domain-containing protein [Mucilaginibacter sp. UR6-11]